MLSSLTKLFFDFSHLVLFPIREYFKYSNFRCYRIRTWDKNIFYFVIEVLATRPEKCSEKYIWIVILKTDTNKLVLFYFEVFVQALNRVRLFVIP